MVAYTVKQANITELNNNNVTMTIEGVEATLNSTGEIGDTITLTSNGAGIFVQSEVYFYGYPGSMFKSFEFTVTSNPKVATLEITENMSGVDLLCPTEIPPVALVINQDDLNTFDANGVTGEVDNIPVELGTQITVGQTLTLLAGSGRAFILGEAYIGGYFGPGGTWVEEHFEISEDRKTATLTLGANLESGRFPITCTTEQVAEDVSGTNNVYLIDQAKLKTLNSERFQFTTDGREIDYGLYILSLLELPFEISEEMILEPENIFLAERDTGISAPKIASDKIVLDLGTIEVPETEYSMLDYLGVEATLYLPRLSPMLLDLNMVLGETIGVQYIIDCYTGNATVNITSSKIGGYSIESKTVNLGVNIPYALTTLNNSILENTSIEVGGDNGIVSPFIEVSRKEIVLKDGFFTVPVSDEGTLLNQTGYIEVENVDINGRLPKSEHDSLLAYLHSGVIIK